jgi:hypothetical protein
MEFYVELPEVWATEFLENDPLCDRYWISSLTQSWQKGYPDNCTLPWTNYVEVVRRLRLHSDKPIVVDVDMLYNEPSIAATVARELFDVGCDAIVVESKRFPKVNSLTPGKMVLSTPEEFCRLINKVKTQVPGLEVIARNEYLATTKDVNKTYQIAKRTINAGADGVVIHWGENGNTDLLIKTLKKLKNDYIKTGIIPTKYLDQVVKGDFDDLVDFSILGNICSSHIRHTFSQQSVNSLLNTPCMFRPILDRVNGHEPEGQKTLVVLGAKENEKGEYLLQDTKIVNQFVDLLGDYYSVVFVTGNDTKISHPKDKNIHLHQVAESIGEVHSLSNAMEYINTEKVTVAYADIDQITLRNINTSGMLFKGDEFAGVMTVDADVLVSMMESIDPTATLIQMGMINALPCSVING